MEKLCKNKALVPNIGDLVPPPDQGNLFHVEKQIEVDGIEMGVLESGVPYLTESGLARMCGIDRKALNRLASCWQEEKFKPRGKKIDELLSENWSNENTLYLSSEHKGIAINAYPEPVCLAILEYYAFITDAPRAQAIKAFRTLARTTFRAFIYSAVGYFPGKQAIDSWQHFHDRIDMTMDSVPEGYFCVFREIASMIVPMIRANIIISDKVIPDISVGKAWSNYWNANNLDQYGDRVRYNHEYPLYYPQAKSNPQSSFAYPECIIGIFRTWLRHEYIIKKLPTYLTGQIRKGLLPEQDAAKVIESFSNKQLRSST